VSPTHSTRARLSRLLAECHVEQAALERLAATLRELMGLVARTRDALGDK
jgi:hypothetical protein